MTVGDPMLDDAIEAARLDEGLAPSDVAATRSRVLESLAQRRTRRRGLSTFALVAALCMIGTTSWAWVSGWLPARLGGAAEPWQPTRDVPSVSPGRAGSPRVAAAPVAPAAEVAEAAEAAVAPTPPTAPVAPPSAGSPAPRAPAPTRPRTPSATRGQASENRTPAPPAAEARDAELVAFRQAHEAHFRGDAKPAVLASWDAYLARFPKGRLAPEARWNRAVLLVELGERDAARAALTPFAEGVDGGYRRREAQRLLQLLDDAAGAPPR